MSLGLALLVCAFILFGNWFMNRFGGKQATWQMYVVFFSGFALIRLVFVLIGERYRVLGTVEVTGDAMILKDLNDTLKETIPFDEMTFIARQAGISMSGSRNSRASTARVCIYRKGKPSMLIETEWRSVNRKIDIEDLIKLVREYRNLPVFASRKV